MKHGLHLNQDDLRQIKTSDPTLFKIIAKMESENSQILNNYVLEKKTLYTTSEVYGQTVYLSFVPAKLLRA